LIIWFLLLGTGTVGLLHNLQHQRQDALLANAGTLPPGQIPHHDESNCLTHALLHAPMLSPGLALLLICLGLLVALLTVRLPALTPQRVPSAFNCRGPPRR
jgi:hypothetical protein